MRICQYTGVIIVDKQLHLNTGIKVVIKYCAVSVDNNYVLACMYVSVSFLYVNIIHNYTNTIAYKTHSKGSN